MLAPHATESSQEPKEPLLPLELQEVAVLVCDDCTCHPALDQLVQKATAQLQTEAIYSIRASNIDLVALPFAQKRFQAADTRIAILPCEEHNGDKVVDGFGGADRVFVVDLTKNAHEQQQSIVELLQPFLPISDTTNPPPAAIPFSPLHSFHQWEREAPPTPSTPSVIISQAYESASQSISLDQMPGTFSKSSKISFGSLPQATASYTHMPQAAPVSSPSIQIQAPQQQSYFSRPKGPQSAASGSYFTAPRKRSGPSWLTILLMIAIAAGSYFLGRQSQNNPTTPPAKRQTTHAPKAGTQPAPSKRHALAPPQTRPTQRTPTRTTPKPPTRQTDDKNNKDADDKDDDQDDDQDDTSPSNKRPVERPSDPEPRPKARKRQPTPRVSPKQQALLDQTAAFNKGWIGGLCNKDSSCETKDATCLPGRNGGFCSMSCTTVCPDRKGATPSYCVNTPLAKRAGDDAKGLCLPRCNYRMFPGRGCRLGAICRKMTWRRFPKRKRYVCVPVLAK